jgi:hypothetical protein
MMLWSSVSTPVSLVLCGSAIMPTFGRWNHAEYQTRARWRD